MFSRASLLTIATVLTLVAPRSAAVPDSFVIIVNRANPATTLTPAEASKLFLRKQTKWPDGQVARPIDQSETSPVRRRFSDVIHHMDVPSVKSYWQELVFSGRGEPPPERASDADVIAFVKANPSAIGYVASTAPVAEVKVISVTP
jgi:ABC-type phosphate transport system substrate-binding protein